MTDANLSTDLPADASLTDLPAAASTAPYFYAVSDAHGLVGTFMTEFEIEEKLLRPYPIVEFLIQRFPLASGSVDQVWAVIYLNGVIAYVSNSRSEALRIQTAMAKIGIVFDENIDFWQHPMGKLVTAAEERLDSISQAHSMYMSGTATDASESAVDAEVFAKFMKKSEDGPIARLLKENKRISFLENIVDIPVSDTGSGTDTGTVTGTVTGTDSVATASDPVPAASDPVPAASSETTSDCI